MTYPKVTLIATSPLLRKVAVAIKGQKMETTERSGTEARQRAPRYFFNVF